MPERVAVFRVDLDQAVLEDVLSPDEVARADRFVQSRDRARYVSAHTALRRVLAAETGRPAASLRFECGRHGKPFLSDAAGLHFNMSHAAGQALVAVCHGAAVGVDIEAIRGDTESEHLARLFFSQHEQTELRHLPSAQRVAGFFNGWTRKEAYLKGRGDGIAAGLDHFDVTLAPAAPVRLLADRHDAGAPGRWSLVELPAPEGFAAALAVEADLALVTVTVLDGTSLG